MSTATFTKTALTNDRYLVRGTDQFGTENSIVLDGTEFNRFDAKDAHKAAHAEFDDAITSFYAPLLAAEEKLASSHKDSLDPLTYVVEQEEVKAVAGVPEIKTILDADTVVLRAVTIGLFDRLVWVGDSLEVLAETEDADEAVVGLPGDADIADAIGNALSSVFGPDVQVQAVNITDLLGGATDESNDTAEDGPVEATDVADDQQ